MTFYGVGDSKLGAVSFPSGKGVYDDKTGTWVDSLEYKREHATRKGFLIGVRSDANLSITRPDGDRNSVKSYSNEKFGRIKYQ